MVHGVNPIYKNAVLEIEAFYLCEQSNSWNIYILESTPNDYGSSYQIRHPFLFLSLSICVILAHHLINCKNKTNKKPSISQTLNKFSKLSVFFFSAFLFSLCILQVRQQRYL